MINTTASYLLGLGCAALAITHSLPIILAFATGDWPIAGLFLASFVLTAFLAGGFIVTARGRIEHPSRKQFIILVAIIWFLLPAIAALPLYASGIFENPVHAYFEAVSGFTTTGATAISDLDAVAKPLILWRSALQFLGGFFTILTALLMLAPFGISGAPVNAHIPGYEQGDLVKSAKLVSVSLLPVYGALTSACLLSLWAAGIPLFDAVNLAFSTISTGGFMPRSGTIDIYQAPFANGVLSLFMLIGATSFLAHRAHLRRHHVGGHDENPETFVLVASCLAAGLVLAVFFGLTAPNIEQATWMSAIVTGLFRAISLLTTTGFSIGTEIYGPIPFVLVLGICLVGGAAFSTAGGIKMFRAMLILRQGVREMERLVHPHGITQARSTGRMINMQLMKSIWVLCFVYLASVGVIALILSLDGLTFETALMSAVSALSNIGPALSMSVATGVGVVQYSDMSTVAQLVLIFGMVMGRIELLVLLSLVSTTFWRR